VSPQAANQLAYDVGRFADMEGLTGHAAAARAWMVENKGGRTRMAKRALHSKAKRIREGETGSGKGDDAGAEEME
jgi:histidinol dehydrogenase